MTEPPSRPTARPGRGILLSAVSAAALGSAAWVAPGAAAILLPAALVVAGAGGWLAARSRTGPGAEAALRAELEQLRDRAFELADSEERYRAMAEARRRAEAASDAKSRFLATVSHEVRTPLTGILGLTDILLETSLTPEQESFARALRTSGELMLGLIDDMLDIAKIEAGRFELHIGPASPERLADEVVELLAVRAHAKGLDIGAYVAPDVPERLAIDAARLRQVLINLVANAVKFTERGGVALLIEPEPGRPGEIRFAVADSGPGIAADAAERIFGEFERAAADQRQRLDGSGLGLAISRRIVRGMGADIAVAPRPGGGSVFSFVLSGAGEGAAADGAASLAGRRFLVAAPAGAAPELLVRHLADAGAAARAADSASLAAALAGAAAAAGEPYDAILLDGRLGDGAVETIRGAAGRRLPAAVLIQPGRRRSVEEMRAAGFDAYLVRPVRRASLLRIAEQLAAAAGEFGIDPSDSRRPARPPRPGGPGLRVLLAEDDMINALLLRSVLQRFGHEVVEAADGRAAIEAAMAGRIDAAFLDMHLPHEDGPAVARAIRARERRDGLPPMLLAAISADPRPEMREAALAAGCDLFLEKPLGADAIRRVLVRPADAAA